MVDCYSYGNQPSKQLKGVTSLDQTSKGSDRKGHEGQVNLWDSSVSYLYHCKSDW